MDNQQPVALVTGGSRGIGRAICQALAGAGYAVAVNYVGNEAAARATLASLSSGLIVQGDVSQSNDRQRMVATVLEKFDRLDVLVNNAGIASPGRRDLFEATEESWDQVLAVNLKGPYFLSQLVARHMVENVARLQQPAIINISSINAVAASTNRGDYCIAKAGMTMMTRVFAVRLAEHGIRVYEVRPGLFTTDLTEPVRERYNKMFAAGLAPINRWGEPEEVGKAVAAVATGAIPFSTGNAIEVDGGFHIPRF